ncbi:MAG: zinc ribbon domain-containing protein [Epulopiscium sp.]|nr:zinc ribbon domain-containing protein [Candidatus Epulonipiscium sp.]
MPFDDWRNKLAQALKTVKDGTGELYQTTKVNVDLGKEQEVLKKIYYEIGKKVHEIYQYGGSLGKFFDEKYTEIKEVEEKIEELQKKMEELRKSRICIECGKEVEKGAKFCPKCGAPMNDSAKEEAMAKIVKKEESQDTLSQIKNKVQSQKVEIKRCPTCRAENQMEDKFCLSCGRALF